MDQFLKLVIFNLPCNTRDFEVMVKLFKIIVLFIKIQELKNVR